MAASLLRRYLFILVSQLLLAYATSAVFGLLLALEHQLRRVQNKAALLLAREVAQRLERHDVLGGGEGDRAGRFLLDGEDGAPTVIIVQFRVDTLDYA